MLIESYREARDRYFGARAVGNWIEAEARVVEMIECRPCDEALPQLTQWLGECRQEVARTESPWLRALSAVGIRKAVAR